MLKGQPSKEAKRQAKPRERIKKNENLKQR
jgi:hypothetical protein